MPAKIKKEKRRKKSKTNEKKQSKIMLIILLFLIILLGILVGMSLAKYQNKINGKVFANIAKPVVEIRREESMLITALAPKASYVFEIRNFKEDELNQVEMEYYIEIIGHMDNAIKFELYKEEKQIPLKENKTEKIVLTKEEKQIHSYRLEMTYDKTKGVLEKDINDNVEIKIYSIQKS